MTSTEKAKRLAPSGQTLRELFLKSGNLCAFPGCNHLMMNAEGVFVGQICHIEAAEEGGERFNPNSDNEARRQFGNLLLMCHAHHKVTDDVQEYPVHRMRQIKSDHERRFSNPDGAMLAQLRDWTRATEPSMPRTLRRLSEELDLGLSDEQLREYVQDLTEYVETLRKVPVEVRNFLRIVIERAYYMRDTNAVSRSWSDAPVLRIDDLRRAYHLTDTEIGETVSSMEAYGVGGLAEISEEYGISHGVSVYGLKSGWPLWFTLKEFCDAIGCDLAVFAIDLDFARLDA